MAPTAAGAASGLTMPMVVQASITHNQFSLLSGSPFVGLEVYKPTGNFITIGLVQGKIDDGGFTPGTPGTVPVPGSLALLGIGLLGAGFARRRRAD